MIRKQVVEEARLVRKSASDHLVTDQEWDQTGKKTGGVESGLQHGGGEMLTGLQTSLEL
jgi:hypothetical protein